MRNFRIHRNNRKWKLTIIDKMFIWLQLEMKQTKWMWPVVPSSLLLLIWYTYLTNNCVPPNQSTEYRWIQFIWWIAGMKKSKIYNSMESSKILATLFHMLSMSFHCKKTCVKWIRFQGTNEYETILVIVIDDQSYGFFMSCTQPDCLSSTGFPCNGYDDC